MVLVKKVLLFLFRSYIYPNMIFPNFYKCLISNYSWNIISTEQIGNKILIEMSFLHQVKLNKEI